MFFSLNTKEPLEKNRFQCHHQEHIQKIKDRNWELEWQEKIETKVIIEGRDFVFITKALWDHEYSGS